MDAMPNDADVFFFDKTLLTRLQECTDVLQCSDQPVPASRVRFEWAYFVEVRVEPAGWQAFWRIPRIICESFHIAYPTVVFGTVESVVFNELRAHFRVTGVQDVAVQLPERHEVALVDLLAVQQQENDALNVEATANCVDMLRYFYQHVWRPWDNDNDDDQDWATQHLQQRIRFHNDLVSRRVSRPLAAHIRALLAEAQDLQQRREYLETDISDDEDVNETQHKNEITDLMRLHLRLTNIRSEMEILENPEMRDIYEDVRKRTDAAASGAADGDATALIVSPLGTLAVQKLHLAWCETFVKANALTRMMSTLQQCLDQCLISASIYLPAGRHAIKFLEPLQGALSIVGRRRCTSTETIGNGSGNGDGADADCTYISAREDESKLLTIEGDVCVEGVTFDCRRVRTGILLRRGRLVLRNCHFVGDERSNTKCALTIAVTGVGAATTVELIDCSIRHFAIGINVVARDCTEDGGGVLPTTVRLASTEIAECGTAVECASGRSGCSVHMELGTRIGPNRRYGCVCTRSQPVEGAPAKEVLASIDDSDAMQLPFTGNGEFVNNKLGNIVRFNYNPNRLFDEEEADDDNANEVIEAVHQTKSDQQNVKAFLVPSMPMEKSSTADRAADDRMSPGSEGEQILVSDSESDLSTSVIMVDD